MDPTTNLREQRGLTAAILAQLDSDPEGVSADDVARLCELASSLDGWLRNGGFPPEGWPQPADPQLAALGRLMRDRPDKAVAIMRKPFDLPEGYWMATFGEPYGNGFVCGIAPDGSVSS